MTARATDVCWRSHDTDARSHEELERPFGRAAAAAIFDARANVPRWQASPIVIRTKEVTPGAYAGLVQFPSPRGGRHGAVAVPPRGGYA